MYNIVKNGHVFTYEYLHVAHIPTCPRGSSSCPACHSVLPYCSHSYRFRYQYV